MLELAILHQEELTRKWHVILNTKRVFYYYMNYYMPYDIKISTDDFNMLQFVSVDNDGEVIGYLAATLDYVNRNVTNIEVIVFSEKCGVAFFNDMVCFFRVLFAERNFRKIVFRSISINPAMKLYTKLVEKYKLGRIVGILKENCTLSDGLYYDEVIFEFYRESFLNSELNCIYISRNTKLGGAYEY